MLNKLTPVMAAPAISWGIRSLMCGYTSNPAAEKKAKAKKSRTIQLGSPLAVLFRIDTGATFSLFLNANPTPDNAGHPPGHINGAAGLGINADPAGTNDFALAVHRVRMWGGAGIANEQSELTVLNCIFDQILWM